MLDRLSFIALTTLLTAGCLGNPLAEREGEPFAAYTSPTGVYTVSLSGRPERVPGGMLGSGVHIIRSQVTKNGVLLVSPREIHYADSMDDGFSDDYCGADWVLSNVLRFQACYPEPGASHRTSYMLHLVNLAKQSMTYLEVSTAADMLLVLELEPGGDVRIPITGRTDGNWFRTRGLWADGGAVPSVSTNFYDLPAKSDIQIEIGPTRVAVQREHTR